MVVAGTTITMYKKRRIAREKINDNIPNRLYLLLKNVNIHAPNPHPSKAEEIAMNAKWYQSKDENTLVSSTSNINPVREIRNTPINVINLGFIFSGVDK